MNIGILLSSIVLAFSVVFIAKTIKKRWLKVIIIISLIAIATLITYFTNGYL
ncbi:putative membrane protein [Clostridioides difficile CD160]|nr:putative membrane protein [Clostridioides difficile CD160]